MSKIDTLGAVHIQESHGHGHVTVKKIAAMLDAEELEPAQAVGVL